VVQCLEAMAVGGRDHPDVLCQPGA
jgi:hypothetical protein